MRGYLILRHIKPSFCSAGCWAMLCHHAMVTPQILIPQAASYALFSLIHLDLKGYIYYHTFMNIFWGSLVSDNGISAHGFSVVFSQWGSFIYTRTLGNFYRSGSEKLAESRVRYKEAMLLKPVTEGVICFPAEQEPGVKSTKVGYMYVFIWIARELHKQ